MKWNKVTDTPQNSRRVLIAIKNEFQDDPPAVTFDGLYHKPTNKFIIPGLHDYEVLAWMELPEYTPNIEQ